MDSSKKRLFSDTAPQGPPESLKSLMDDQLSLLSENSRPRARGWGSFPLNVPHGPKCHMSTTDLNIFDLVPTICCFVCPGFTDGTTIHSVSKSETSRLFLIPLLSHAIHHHVLWMPLSKSLQSLLSPSCHHSLGSGLIIPHLNHRNSLWDGLPAFSNAVLQCTQRDFF